MSVLENGEGGLDGAIEVCGRCVLNSLKSLHVSALHQIRASRVMHGIAMADWTIVDVHHSAAAILVPSCTKTTSASALDPDNHQLKIFKVLTPMHIFRVDFDPVDPLFDNVSFGVENGEEGGLTYLGISVMVAPGVAHVGPVAASTITSDAPVSADIAHTAILIRIPLMVPSGIAV